MQTINMATLGTVSPYTKCKKAIYSIKNPEHEKNVRTMIENGRASGALTPDQYADLISTLTREYVNPVFAKQEQMSVGLYMTLVVLGSVGWFALLVWVITHIPVKVIG